MSAVENMTDDEIRRLIAGFEPHNEGGQSVMTLHLELWQRVLKIAAPAAAPALTDEYVAEVHRAAWIAQALTEGRYSTRRIAEGQYERGKPWALSETRFILDAALQKVGTE